MSHWTRAQVLMGTLVTLEVDRRCPMQAAFIAMEAALNRMAHIARVMSAHDPGSDLGRLSRATPEQTLRLDPHTVRVLQAARDWVRQSGGAFDPVQAAHTLSQRGLRPGLSRGTGGLRDLDVCSAVEVRVRQAVAIDLGGIAKGYAVDQALQVLREHDIAQARVNAGGDLAVMGPTPQRIALRHAGVHARSQNLGHLRLCEGAVATSTATPSMSDMGEMVARPRRAPVRWHSATVMAPDCMTADALTKWALQSTPLCPLLKRALREHRATLWRSA